MSPLARRRFRAVAIAFAVLVALAAGGYAWGDRHVRRVTGGRDDVRPVCLNCHGTGAGGTRTDGPAHPDPSALVASRDGATLFVVCGPTRTLVAVDVAARTPRSEVALPGVPRGIALSPDGSTLAVSLTDADCVVFVDAATLGVIADVKVGAEPAGVAFADSGRTLIVANAGSRDVSVVDVASRAERGRVAAGREPYVAVASPDGQRVAIVSRMVTLDDTESLPRSEVTIVDARTGTASSRVDIPSCHLAESAAFTPDGTRLLVPMLRVRNLLPILQVGRGWVMSGTLAVIDVATGGVALMPLNDVNACLSDPTAIAVSADGRRAWIAAGGSDEIAEIDLPAMLALEGRCAPDAPECLSLSPDYVLRRVRTGDHPRALAVLADGSLAVAERLDDSVAFLRADGTLAGRTPVGRFVREDAIRRGDRTFHDASYAFQGSFSCRSCHPDGHTDGLTYDFEIDGVGRQIVLNRSLRGLAGTDPFKWTGSNPTLQRQCGPRFAMVLTRADPFPEDVLDDSVAYLESLPAPRSDPRAGRFAGGDTKAVERGRRLFHRTHRKDGTEIPPQGRCITCHAGPHLTNRLKADVGTRGPRDPTGDLDVPHLTGIASKAPYLHDGRAQTLEEIWTAPGVGDLHGVVTDFTKQDLNDLVEFLRGL